MPSLPYTAACITSTQWDLFLSIGSFRFGGRKKEYEYYTTFVWNFRGVTGMQLIDDMLPVIYNKQPAPFGEDYSGPHDLALLFIIMAIGTLVCHEPSKALGEHYYQISRVAISLQPVLEKPSIVTIQTLYLMSIYNAMSGSDLKSETSMEMTWSLVTLASHLRNPIYFF
jgi:transcription factor-like protein